MSTLRVTGVTSFVTVLVVACGGGEKEAPAPIVVPATVTPPTSVTAPASVTPPTPISATTTAPPKTIAPGDVCAAASVPSTAACPTRTVPPGNGTGPDRCQSDADCKGPGTDGRCIKNPARADLAPLRAAGNLFAAPPPPPSHAICVYDACRADADCGAQSRCACGSGAGDDRNHCVPLDQCKADRDCKADNICQCTTTPFTGNYCVLGNCHSDADCKGGFTCDGAHCHSSKDTCKTAADCTGKAPGIQQCNYSQSARRFECRAVPPRPPG